MCDGDGQLEAIAARLLQGVLPALWAVATDAHAEHQQLPGPGLASTAFGHLPVGGLVYGEATVVGRAAKVDPAGFGLQIVDVVRHGLARGPQGTAWSSTFLGHYVQPRPLSLTMARHNVPPCH